MLRSTTIMIFLANLLAIMSQSAYAEELDVWLGTSAQSGEPWHLSLYAEHRNRWPDRIEVGC